MKARLAAALLLALQSPFAAAQSPEPWKLSTMMALTGSYAGYSQELKLGFDIALEEINRKGGIQGRPVTLQMLDTQSSPGQVATLIRQACSDSLIVLGPALSNEARVAFPVANSLQCPAIAPSAAAIGLTSNNRPWTFAYLTSSDLITSTAVDTVVRKLKPKKAIVIIEKADPSASDYGELASKALAHNQVDISSMTVVSSDVDYGPVITRLAGANPELVVISAMDRASIGLLKELRKTKQSASILLTQSAYNALVGSLPPDVLEGVYRYAQSDPGTSTDPRVKEFVKTFESRANGRHPSLVATLTYDTLMLTKDVIEGAGLKGGTADRVADRKKFIDKMQTMHDWTGLGGKVSMSPQGYMIKAPVILQYHAGKWEPQND